MEQYILSAKTFSFKSKNVQVYFYFVKVTGRHFVPQHCTVDTDHVLVLTAGKKSGKDPNIIKPSG